MITLATLPQATAQEVFDQVVNHLLTQKWCSKNDFTCAYRGFDNMKCAAGCLIADDEYDEDKMEGKSWKTLANDQVVPIVHHELIHALQRIHDGDPVWQWEERLRQLAVTSELQFNYVSG